MPNRKTDKFESPPYDKQTILRGHKVFKDLEPEAFQQIVRYAKSRKFTRGGRIFSKGDPGTSLFLVANGTVKIGVSSTDGRDAIFNLIGEGEMFGEVALFDGQPRTADAIANTDCEVLVIDRREFLPFVERQPALAMRFIELLCNRLRWVSAHVEQVMLPDLPGRLAKAIIRLIEKSQARAMPKRIVVTQQEMSEMVGMSRESINKQLRIWENHQWVRLEHGAIVVLNEEPIRRLAEAS